MGTHKFPPWGVSPPRLAPYLGPHMADLPPSPDETRKGPDSGSTTGASRWQKVIAMLGLLVVAWVGDQVYEKVTLDAFGTGGPGLHGPGPGEAPTGTPQPPGSATPPAAPSSLPPGFLECAADQGFDIQSEADIHSLPPKVLQACFGAVHEGGGAP